MFEANAVESFAPVDEPSIEESVGTPVPKRSPRTPLEVKMKTPILDMDTNERQRRYVESQKSSGGGLGVVFQDAFIRGMREIGYKNAAWSIAEIIDNAIQASAQKIEVRLIFNLDNKSRAKPDQIALIDDGAGMIPEMISYAVRWGGTDREDDRNGFGRFGYGLPSASVSMARRYTVYSKANGSEWHAVTIDLEELTKLSADPAKTDAYLKAKPVSLPKSILITPENGIDVTTLSKGTIVVLEDLDRLRRETGWITTKALKSKLLDNLGAIYRHWLSDIEIVVEGTKCEVVDPLFLMPHARHYCETKVVARAVNTRAFEVKTESGKTGMVRIRAAILPPLFSWSTPDDLSSRKLNSRWEILKRQDYNGLLVCREGRYIDSVTPNWTKFQNQDRYLKIEIDFDPALDEYFGVTTSKQQITIDDVMWEKLKSPGKEAGNLISLVREMRSEWETANDALKAALQNLKGNSAAPLPSGEAMMVAEKFKTRTPQLTKEKQDEANKNLAEKIEERAKAEGVTKETATREVEEQIARRPWDIEFKAIDEGVFYIPKRLGTQRVIIVNTSHPFYKKVYNEATMNRSAWEVLLFTLADCEIDALGERAKFYRAERTYWSETLRHALDHLVMDSEVKDRESSRIEAEEVSQG
jgi:hypothetical protein